MAQKVWFSTSGKAFRENCAEDDQVNLKSTLKKEQQKSVLFCFYFLKKIAQVERQFIKIELLETFTKSPVGY